MIAQMNNLAKTTVPFLNSQVLYNWNLLEMRCEAFVYTQYINLKKVSTNILPRNINQKSLTFWYFICVKYGLSKKRYLHL